MTSIACWFSAIFNDIGLTLSFISLLVAVFSLIVSVIISVMLYRLQRHHEKEVEQLQEQQRLKEIENDATVFLIDNATERDYLPTIPISKLYQNLFDGFSPLMICCSVSCGNNN